MGRARYGARTVGQGTHFRILGRAKKAEARLRRHHMSEKVAWSSPLLRRFQQSTEARLSDVRLLLDGQANYTPRNFQRPSTPPRFRRSMTSPALADQLKAAAAARQLYDRRDHRADRAAACRWAPPDSPLACCGSRGLQFLSSCAKPSMRNTADRSLRARGFLDGFRPEDGSNRRLPMGAAGSGSCCDWLAGTGPLLGQCYCSPSRWSWRNATLRKRREHRFSSVLPAALLEDFPRGLEVRSPAGRMHSVGDDLLAATAVIYYPRDDYWRPRRNSRNSPMCGWPGEAMKRSNRCWRAPRALRIEDIIFGPKLVVRG